MLALIREIVDPKKKAEMRICEDTETEKKNLSKFFLVH